MCASVEGELMRGVVEERVGRTHKVHVEAQVRVFWRHVLTQPLKAKAPTGSGYTIWKILMRSKNKKLTHQWRWTCSW